MKTHPLSADQVEFVCQMVSEYIKVCQQNQKQITPDSIEHSCLLRRLLAGKKPLGAPPPLRFGLPSYEMVENQEIEVQRVEQAGEDILIDQHPGYRWLDRDKGIIIYPRLSLRFQLHERDVLPDASCVAESGSIENYKYTGKFLRRLEDDQIRRMDQDS